MSNFFLEVFHEMETLRRAWSSFSFSFHTADKVTSAGPEDGSYN